MTEREITLFQQTPTNLLRVLSASGFSEPSADSAGSAGRGAALERRFLGAGASGIIAGIIAGLNINGNGGKKWRGIPGGKPGNWRPLSPFPSSDPSLASVDGGCIPHGPQHPNWGDICIFSVPLSWPGGYGNIGGAALPPSEG